MARGKKGTVKLDVNSNRFRSIAKLLKTVEYKFKSAHG